MLNFISVIYYIAEPEINIDGHLEAIQMDSCTWAELETHWSATTNYRLRDIMASDSLSNLLNTWKLYKKPMGYKLVSLILYINYL